MNDAIVRRLIAPLVAAVALAALAGCSRGDELRCESDSRYRTASSVPPLRVPGDLSLPDETDVLRIPDSDPVGSAPASDTACLETPPGFFEEGEPDE